MPFRNFNGTRELWLKCSCLCVQMASYYDEHNCEPLAPGQAPDHLMHIARLLIDTGAWNQVSIVFPVKDWMFLSVPEQFNESLELPLWCGFEVTSVSSRFSPCGFNSSS